MADEPIEIPQHAPPPWPASCACGAERKAPVHLLEASLHPWSIGGGVRCRRCGAWIVGENGEAPLVLEDGGVVHADRELCDRRLEYAESVGLV